MRREGVMELKNTAIPTPTDMGNGSSPPKAILPDCEPTSSCSNKLTRYLSSFPSSPLGQRPCFATFLAGPLLPAASQLKHKEIASQPNWQSTHIHLSHPTYPSNIPWPVPVNASFPLPWLPRKSVTSQTSTRNFTYWSQVWQVQPQRW